MCVISQAGQARDLGYLDLIGLLSVFWLISMIRNIVLTSYNRVIIPQSYL
jgi:hypothetical protein